MLGLYQRHALKALRASVGDEEGHKGDCILVGLACRKQTGGYGGILEGLFILAVSALYLFGLLMKTIECIFSNCEEKGGLAYVFRPFWKDKSEQVEEYCDPAMDSCNTDTFENDDCDPGMESCD